MKINENNFFKSTFANFQFVDETNEELNRPADFESPDGSIYWYTSEGVYRKSDHWSEINKAIYESPGFIAFCVWTLYEVPESYRIQLDPRFGSRFVNDHAPVVGFCRWEDFIDLPGLYQSPH